MSDRLRTVLFWSLLAIALTLLITFCNLEPEGPQGNRIIGIGINARSADSKVLDSILGLVTPVVIVGSAIYLKAGKRK